MNRKPGESPQSAGRRFEQFWAKLFGVKPTPGSGNGWRVKLDVSGSSFTWSCKFSTHRSVSISKELLREAESAAHNNGDNSIPGISIAFDDGAEVVVVLRHADFMRLLTTNQRPKLSSSKDDQKRLNAAIPALLRDADQEQ